jgi:hypothetical protein
MKSKYNRNSTSPQEDVNYSINTATLTSSNSTVKSPNSIHVEKINTNILTHGNVSYVCLKESVESPCLVHLLSNKHQNLISLPSYDGFIFLF